MVYADDTSTEKQSYDPTYFRKRFISIAEKLPDRSGKLCEFLRVRRPSTLYSPDFSVQEYSTREMEEDYANEQVTYLTQEGLEKAQVFIVNNTVFRADLSRYSSSEPVNETMGTGDMIVWTAWE